jgi:hypothetical protein
MPAKKTTLRKRFGVHEPQKAAVLWNLSRELVATGIDLAQ